MAFNENSRVKIPTILHLVRLGYTYLPLSQAKWDLSTNIFNEIFLSQLLKINPELDEPQAKRVLDDIILKLDSEDLGKAFYEMLVSRSGVKLIDFDRIENNSFHVVTELTCKNGDEEFRPDITLLINGLPLAFIEVKKPNNKEGILAERDRINARFRNKKFRKFANISQILLFSNNMPYDNDPLNPVQGAYYATTSYDKTIFNYFREEQHFDLDNILLPLNDDVENTILRDNNLITIKHSPEFDTNKNPKNPTNTVVTSLFSKERFIWMLRYGFAYVQELTKIEKHIMRYPQLFATKAIEQKINQGKRKGIIWHTQGSGKTALAYFNVKFLTDYFQKQGVIPKFYFIVDRLDLMIQASNEFKARGLSVRQVNSREEFKKDMKTAGAIHNLSGKSEISVINIQKFSEGATANDTIEYDINVQRIYFIDEAHRSYGPEGEFLVNLVNSDKNAIKIALTGTPLIGKDLKSKDLFGDYIHKYYYNSSIADGYTLKLIREEIETSYKMSLEEALKEIEVLEGDLDKRQLYAHEKFAEPMLEYIVQDFERSRILYGDNSIGGMVVCESSDQAKKMFELFTDLYEEKVIPLYVSEPGLNIAAEDRPQRNNKHKVKTAALILHDIGTKDDRKTQVESFKEGHIDLLFVYNMLLTGFDAKRLKKLYLGRVIKDHNLLQTLTRVNRPYKEFKYGFVVDFADISKEFDLTNRAYFEELKAELGDDMDHYNDLFKSKEQIEEEIAEIKELLFHFDTLNAEIFSQQISQISDRDAVLKIKKALENVKSLYNLIRLLGYDELLAKIDFKKLGLLYREVSSHLDSLNQREALLNYTDTTNLLNVALENIVFMFRKISEEELILADELKDALRKTREALANNFDQRDPEFVSLYEELERLFKKKNLDEITQEEMRQNIGALRLIYDKVTELNRKNNLLRAKYESDQKYARTHKRLVEQGNITQKESVLFEALQQVKHDADEHVLQNNRLLENENYFEGLMMKMVMDVFKTKNNIPLDVPSAKFINGLIVKEYLNEYNGRGLW
ncbi:MAG: type I restriction endonuclease [Bacteroidota bacterium]